MFLLLLYIAAEVSITVEELPPLVRIPLQLFSSPQTPPPLVALFFFCAIGKSSARHLNKGKWPAFFFINSAPLD